MDPDTVLTAEGGNVVTVKNASNGALAVEMSVDGESEDASGCKIATPALQVLLRTPEGMQTNRCREGTAETGWMVTAGTASSGSKPGRRNRSRTNPPGKSFRSRTCICGGEPAAAAERAAGRQVRRTVVLREIICMIFPPLPCPVGRRTAWEPFQTLTPTRFTCLCAPLLSVAAP
jgi:hypothetical protein